MLLHFWMQHIIYDIKTQVLFKRNCRHSQKKEKRKRQFKKKKKKIERQMRILKNIHAHCAWNLFSGAVTSVIHFDNGTNGNNCYNWTAGTFWNSFEGAPQSHFATLFVSEASCHDKCNQKRIMDLKRSMKHKRMYSESASKSCLYLCREYSAYSESGYAQVDILGVSFRLCKASACSFDCHNVLA